MLVVFVGYIAKIVTHHLDTRGAAESWARLGVCAVGFVQDRSVMKENREGIKSYMRKKRGDDPAIPGDAGSFIRDEMQIGDIVFAYTGDNIVGLVGKVTGKAIYDDENEVGKDFNYPNQRDVNWWLEPRFFDRRELPHDVSNWVKVTGTILRKEYDTEELTRIIEGIKSGQMKDALETSNEEEIQNFIELNMEKVEDGLILVEREKSVAGTSMDFLARDKDGTHVVIEVKQWGTPDSLTQLRGYMRDYRREEGIENIRGLLVALDFSRRCVEEWDELVQAGFCVTLSRVKKTFSFSPIEQH